jgi:hypothetical protein
MGRIKTPVKIANARRREKVLFIVVFSPTVIAEILRSVQDAALCLARVSAPYRDALQPRNLRPKTFPNPMSNVFERWYLEPNNVVQIFVI